MAKKRTKSVRTRGKMSFSEYFKNLKIGDRVALVRNLSLKKNFPDRMQGRTGVVESKRGRAYIVKVNDYNEEKRYI